MSTLGTLILIVFAIIAFGALCLAFADRGDDSTGFDDEDWVHSTAVEVVAAVAWPQPQTVLHDKLPLDTPMHHSYIESDDEGVPLWYHKQRGTTPVYYAANLIATLRRERPAEADHTPTSHTWGQAPGTPAQRALFQFSTGAFSVRELVGAGAS